MDGVVRYYKTGGVIYKFNGNMIEQYWSRKYSKWLSVPLSFYTISELEIKTFTELSESDIFLEIM